MCRCHFGEEKEKVVAPWCDNDFGEAFDIDWQVPNDRDLNYYRTLVDVSTAMSDVHCLFCLVIKLV